MAKKITKEERRELNPDAFQYKDTEDPVNHPKHYNNHPSGVECLTIVRHENFNVGNAIKYLWRAKEKSPEKHIEDLKKARFYIDDEISRLQS